MPLPWQLAVCRLARYATQPSGQHTRAATASPAVETLPGRLALRAEDKGQGIEPTASTTGIGLKTLRSRVELLVAPCA